MLGLSYDFIARVLNKGFTDKRILLTNSLGKGAIPEHLLFGIIISAGQNQ